MKKIRKQFRMLGESFGWMGQNCIIIIVGLDARINH